MDTDHLNCALTEGMTLEDIDELFNELYLVSESGARFWLRDGCYHKKDGNWDFSRRSSLCGILFAGVLVTISQNVYNDLPNVNSPEELM